MSDKSKQHKPIYRKDDPKIYDMMDQIIRNHHPHLTEALILLCWKFGWKRNKDGQMTYGKCKKASDFEVALGDFDFVIFLNGDRWDELTAHFQEALLDHELCHAYGEREVHEDGSEGEMKWRIRRHDLEEFNEIVERHGLWRKEVEAFVETGRFKTKGIHDDSLNDEEEAA